MKLIDILKNRGLIRDYLFVTLSAGVLMGILFLIVSFMLWSNTLQNMRQSSEVIFHQTEQQLLSFEKNIDNLYTNLVYNTAITSYLQTDSLEERMEYLEEFRGIVASNRRINPNVLTISLYSLKGDLIASTGDVFIPVEKTEFPQTIHYSGPIVKDGDSYFRVMMQVFRKSGRSYYRIGTISLLLSTEELNHILSASLVNEESGVALIDDTGQLVAGVGIWEKEYTELQEENCVVFRKTLPESGWTLVSATPVASLVKRSGELQRMSYLIFGVALLALFYLCFSMFRHVIRPIYAQTRFIETFTEDTKQRIEIVERNEIGKMAQALNQMLDDMEGLNQEIVRTQCRNLELDYQKKKMEMLAYKNQMNPHFLYNTFDCIRGMALYHQETEIAQLIQSLSALFRYSIKGEEFVTIREVIGQLERYRTIIDYRFMGKYTIILSAPETLEGFRMPKMLLQPLVENAILHGLEESRNGKKVQVRFCKENKACRITVEDDGVGIQPEVMARLNEQMCKLDSGSILPGEGHGIGILNVYRRLQLWYGEKASFRIESEPGKGTAITIIIPDGEAA